MDTATFTSELKDLPQMLSWVRERLERKGLDPKAIRRIELAVEEALVNVIRYAYNAHAGKIEISLKADPGLVEIAIRDWGPAFNPLVAPPAVALEASLEERRSEE